MNPHIHSVQEYPEYSYYDRGRIRDKEIHGRVNIHFSENFRDRPSYMFDFKNMKFYFEHCHPRKTKKNGNAKSVVACEKKLRFLYERLRSEQRIQEISIASEISPDLEKRLDMICQALVAVKGALKNHQHIYKGL